jgi:hypothetical protein
MIQPFKRRASANVISDMSYFPSGLVQPIHRCRKNGAETKRDRLRAGTLMPLHFAAVSFSRIAAEGSTHP